MKFNSESNSASVDKSSKLTTILIGAVVIFLLLFGGILLYNKYAQRKSNSSQNSTKEIKKKITESNEYIKSDKFVEDTKEKTYNEIKKDKPLVASNPNVSSKEAKQKLEDSGVIQQERQKYIVTYDGERVVPKKVVIKQGDVVIFKNNSQNSVKFSGNDWGNRIPLSKGQSFTQEFDFKGNYDYSVIVNENNLDGTVLGVVVVE